MLGCICQFLINMLLNAQMQHAVLYNPPETAHIFAVFNAPWNKISVIYSHGVV